LILSAARLGPTEVAIRIVSRPHRLSHGHVVRLIAFSPLATLIHGGALHRSSVEQSELLGNHAQRIRITAMLVSRPIE
jgi:hypothetical protein